MKNLDIALLGQNIFFLILNRLELPVRTARAPVLKSY